MVFGMELGSGGEGDTLIRARSAKDGSTTYQLVVYAGTEQPR